MTLRRLAAAALLLAVVGAAAAAGVGAWLARWTHTPASTVEGEKVLEVARGSSARAVSEMLAREGVVRDPRLFERYLRWEGASGRLRAGEFRFRTDWSPERVLKALLHDAEVTWPLTVPEGLSMKEIAGRVEAAGLGRAEAFLALCADPDLLRRMRSAHANLEGYLFPETYRFPRGTTERQVVEAMLAEFERHWSPSDEERARQIRLTRDQVVTLASVVEKETGAPEERPLVASVFHNRLARGMKLESDPTIIYGLKDYDGDIRSRDIRDPHPWNTYVVPGLPAGPIASPGGAALRATLHPAETDYLFFVATTGGRHHFSRTYEEHARMVQAWQLRRRPLEAGVGR